MREIREKALEHGIVSFDPSLPQKFFNECIAKTGHNPIGEIVWSYDNDKFLGEPKAITAKGALIICLKNLAD